MGEPVKFADLSDEDVRVLMRAWGRLAHVRCRLCPHLPTAARYLELEREALAELRAEHAEEEPTASVPAPAIH